MHLLRGCTTRGSLELDGVSERLTHVPQVEAATDLTVIFEIASELLLRHVSVMNTMHVLVDLLSLQVPCLFDSAQLGHVRILLRRFLIALLELH